MSLASDARMTGQKLLLAEKQWIGPDAGFQRPSWQVVLFADRITILPEYDGTTAVCSVSIETYNASSSNAVLVDGMHDDQPVVIFFLEWLSLGAVFCEGRNNGTAVM